MNTKRTSHRVLLITILALALSVFGAASVSADSGSATFIYVLGTEPLCGLDPTACPAVAIAENGDTIVMAGAGTLSIHPKSVTGGGSFTHVGANGNVMGSGTWVATELLSFHSYGSAAAQGLPTELEGGKALLRIQLLVGGTPVAEGILRVTCVLGDKIPAGAVEGVRLAVPGLNFNKEVSGFTVYIRVP